MLHLLSFFMLLFQSIDVNYCGIHKDSPHSNTPFCVSEEDVCKTLSGSLFGFVITHCSGVITDGISLWCGRHVEVIEFLKIKSAL